MKKKAIDGSWQNALRPAGPKFEGYDGSLAEPLFVDLRRWHETDDWPPNVIEHPARGALSYTATIERRAKMRIGHLFDCYDVKVGDWEKLAWELIYRHVPGLTVTLEKPTKKPGRGAPRKRTSEHDEDLVLHIWGVRFLRAKRREIPIGRVPLTEAIDASLKNNPEKWEAHGGAKMGRKAAGIRYNDAKKRIRERAAKPIDKLMRPKEIERLQEFISKYM